jgi:hypothetical protein
VPTLFGQLFGVVGGAGDVLGAGTVPAPDFDLPRGPCTVPATLLVPLELLVDVPEAVVVPPLGPVTDPLAVAPLAVLVTVPEPLAVAPRAPVAVPLAVALLLCTVTVPDAVEPLGPVTVFCANAQHEARQQSAAMAAIREVPDMGSAPSKYFQ